MHGTVVPVGVDVLVGVSVGTTAGAIGAVVAVGMGALAAVAAGVPAGGASPSFPVTFTYRVAVPANESGAKDISGQAVYVDGSGQDRATEQEVSTLHDSPLLGDVNADGEVNALDIQAVINAALGLEIEGIADTDGDGKVDAIDVQMVINAGLGVE